MDPVRQVLELVGVRKIRASSEGYSCSCPYHRDTQASCAVNVRKAVFVCYSAKCGQTGPVWIMLRDFLGYSRERAEALVGTDVQRAARREEEEPAFNPAILGVYRSKCPKYLLERGFTKRTLKEWGVGYDEDTDYAVIPVKSADDKVVGIVKRAAVPTSELNGRPKYVHLYYDKGSLLFGEDRVRDSRRIIVTEGNLSPIKAWQAGIRNVVATGGSKVTDTQLNLLANYAHVTLAMDEDPDGDRATTRIGMHLLPRLGHKNVRVAGKFPAGSKDLDEAIDRGENYSPLVKSIPMLEWLTEKSRMGQKKRR